MKIALVTQARTSSTRLPNKVLLKIKNKTLLEYHISRAQSSGYPVIVATSIHTSDNSIVELCQKNKILCFRGDLNNVLNRYYLAAKYYKLDVIVRITSDCPLIDGELVAQGIKFFEKQNVDYISNIVRRTFPTGFDFEIFTFQALERAHRKATKETEKEHVTPFIWQHKDLFSIKHFTQDRNLSRYRITVDQEEDLELVKSLIVDFQADKKNHREITKILEDHPKLVTINKNVKAKKV